MKNSKLTKTLAVIGGVTAVCAVAVGVMYVLKKKNGGKCKKYVSCQPDEDISLEDMDELAEAFAETDEALDLPIMEDELAETVAEKLEDEAENPVDGE